MYKNDATPLTDSFIINNLDITDKLEIAKKFNEYFVNVGPSLANRISDSPVKYNTYLRGDYKDSFSLYPCLLYTSPSPRD